MGRQRQRFSRANRWAVGSIFGIFALAFCGGAIGAVIGRLWGLVAFMIVMIAISVATAWRVITASVIVMAEGLTVRSIWKSRTLEWSKVRGIRMASQNSGHIVQILLNDGSAIRCQALAPTMLGGTKSLDKLAVDLQAAIDPYIQVAEPGA
jgi:hypothetical protein